MKKLSLKGASWDSMFLAVGKILTLLFGIVSSKLLSSGLSLTEYGTYSQANLISAIGKSLILLGLCDAVSYFFNRKDDLDEEKRSRIVNTVFFLEWMIGAVLAFAIILGRDLIAAYFGNEAVTVLIPLVALMPALANIVYFYQVLYVAVGKAKLMSFYSLAMIVVRIITIYLAVYVLKNLVWIFVVMLAQEVAIMLVYHFSLARRGVKIQPHKISKSHIGPIFAYGLPMGVYMLTSELSRDLDKLVIGRMGTTEELAVYTNCSKLLPFDFLVSSFAIVLIPYIVRYVTEKNREESVRLFSSYLKVGYYSVWILATMVLIAPSTMISFLYDEKYVVGLPIFVLYIFDSMLRFASMHLILVSAGKSKNIMIYSIVALGINFVLNIALYALFGLIGPAISTLVSALVYTLLIMNRTVKLLDTRWRDVFDLKDVAWFITSLALLWAAMFALNLLLVHLGLHAYVSMIVCMAIFGLSALAIHFKKIAAVLKTINSFRTAS